jgi:hypothetical protein
MNNLNKIFVDDLVHVPVLLLLLWAIYRRFGSKQPVPAILAIPARGLQLALVLVTLGLLAGCASSDPLAVASGPLFPLNSGHWQPAAQDLAAPPPVADQ